MDARRAGIGIIIPEPMGPPSRLGNVCYIDESGILYPITNMFTGDKVTPLNLPSPPDVREDIVQGIVAVATCGINLRRMSGPEYARYEPRTLLRGYSIADNSGLVLDTSFPPRVTTHKPLRAYEITADRGYLGLSETYIVGPGYTLRTLVVDKELVRTWLAENRRIIESMRVKWVNRTSPQVIVVLQEWICNTWIYVQWKKMEPGVKLGMFALHQESCESAAKWSHLALPGEIFTVTHSVSNVTVCKALEYA